MRDFGHPSSSFGPSETDRRSPRKSVVASALAATFVIGSIAPSFAFNGMGRPGMHARPHRGPVVNSGLRHHGHHAQAYRGARWSGFRATPGYIYGGATLGVGLAGLAAGAMMDDAYSVDPTENAVGYCANRFKSYDPSTGTYMGYDGYEHPCP